MIDLAWTPGRALGIPQAELVINSVGCASAGRGFRRRCSTALGDDLPKLCEDCQRRATTNPLRIYDCKVAGRSADHRSAAALGGLPLRAVRDALRRRASASSTTWGIPWRMSHRLVRGLDYYTRTTFEVLGQTLGAQNALLGGGRYDGLVEAPRRSGSDRASASRPGSSGWCSRCPRARGRDAAPRAFVVGDWRRRPRGGAAAAARAAPGGRVGADGVRGARACKAQMKRADRARARASTLIVGGDELARGEVTLRDMRDGRTARRAACGRRRGGPRVLNLRTRNPEREPGTVSRFRIARTPAASCAPAMSAARSCCSAGCTASAISAALLFFDRARSPRPHAGRGPRRGSCSTAAARARAAGVRRRGRRARRARARRRRSTRRSPTGRGRSRRRRASRS